MKKSIGVKLSKMENTNLAAFKKRAAYLDKRSKQITETDIEQHFVDYATRKGCKTYKLIFLRRRGFPDRTVLCPGAKVMFIEFKRKGKTLSAQQKIIRKVLVGLGFQYHVADEIGIAEEALDWFIGD